MNKPFSLTDPTSAHLHLVQHSVSEIQRSLVNAKLQLRAVTAWEETALKQKSRDFLAHFESEPSSGPGADPTPEEIRLMEAADDSLARYEQAKTVRLGLEGRVTALENELEAALSIEKDALKGCPAGVASRPLNLMLIDALLAEGLALDSEEIQFLAAEVVRRTYLVPFGPGLLVTGMSAEKPDGYTGKIVGVAFPPGEPSSLENMQVMVSRLWTAEKQPVKGKEQVFRLAEISIMGAPLVEIRHFPVV